MRVKSIIARTAKMIGYIVLVVVTLEACARIDDWVVWDAPLFSAYSHQTLSVSDKYGLHNRPNARFQKWRINSYGFRGAEIDREKRDGVTRIIVVGASESFGLHEDEGGEYPARMQAMLDARFPGEYQVLNAACPGLTTVPIHFYYNSWLKSFNPDLVVYYPAADAYLNNKAPSSEYVPREHPSPLPRVSRLAEKAKIVLKEFIPLGWQISARRFLNNRKLAKRPSDWSWTEPPPERVRLFREHLTSFATDVLDDSVRFVIATKASSISDELNEFDRMNMVMWRRWHLRSSHECLIEFYAAANETVREVGAELSIPIVDLEPQIPKTAEYFADVHHFTAKGAEMVASAMVETILKLRPEAGETASGSG
jgi:hypothetical protein